MSNGRTDDAEQETVLIPTLGADEALSAIAFYLGQMAGKMDKLLDEISAVSQELGELRISIETKGRG